MSKPASEMMDLEDRDPSSLSQHLQVSWNDVFGEPDDMRSPECAWAVSNTCFRISRNGCYTCLSVLCAPLAAFCCGITFACLSFEYIWCINPCQRMWKISCGATRYFVSAVAFATIVPIAESLGYIFSQIKLRMQKLPDGPDHKDDILII